MRKFFDRYTLAGAALAFLVWLAAVPSTTIAGIIQAIIPAAVPTANKQGNSSKFQLSTGSFTAGNCTQTDGGGNLVDAGVICNGTGSGTPGATVFSSTTSAGPNNTAAETSLIGTVVGSTSIGANTFTNGAILEARSEGFFSLPAVADSITLKMKCGSTVIGSASTTLGAGVLTNGTFKFWLMITARGSGAGGSFITNGIAQFTGSALTPSDIKVLNTTTVAFDFTQACAFDITAQWGAAQVGESITGTNAAVWFPGAPVTSVYGATGAITSMTVATGQSLTFSGSGTINASGANGTTIAASSAADQGLRTTASGTGSWTALPSCPDSSGNHLNYDTSAHTFSCGTSSGGTTVSFSPPYVISGANTYSRLNLAFIPPAILSSSTAALNGGINNVTTAVTVNANLSPAVTPPFIVVVGTEDMKVTSTGGGTNWTVVRGYNGTSTASHANADTVTLVNWEWVNQVNNGSASFSGGGTAPGYMLSTASSSGVQLRILKNVAPTVAYTVTALMACELSGSGSNRCGILWGEASSGKIQSVDYFGQTDTTTIINWNSATSFNGNVAADSWKVGPSYIWFRIQDDLTTNRTYFISQDGVNFFQVKQVARTNFITPDEIGWFSDSETSFGMGVTLLSWQVTTP